MEMNRLSLEHELRSTSKGIIWKMIATPEGLQKWLADSVRLAGDNLTFAWGDSDRHHETRTARIVEMVQYNRIRWQWEDADNQEYVEIRMERSDVSGNYSLYITDYADDDDMEWLENIWTHNFDRLHRRTGV